MPVIVPLKVVELLQGAHNPWFTLHLKFIILFCTYVNIQYDSTNNKLHDVNLT